LILAVVGLGKTLLGWTAEASVLRVGDQPMYIGFVYSGFLGALIAYALVRTTLVSGDNGTVLLVGPAVGGWISPVFVLIALAGAIWAFKASGVLIRKSPFVRFVFVGTLVILLLHDLSANISPFEGLLAIMIFVIMTIRLVEYFLIDYFSTDYSVTILPSFIMMPVVFVLTLASLWGVLAVGTPATTAGHSGQMVAGMIHFAIQSGVLDTRPPFPIHTMDSVPSLIDIAVELTAMTWVMSVCSSCFVPQRIYDHVNPDQADVPEVVAFAYETVTTKIRLEKSDVNEVSTFLELVDAALAPGVWAPAEMRLQLIDFRRRARTKLDELDTARVREQAHTLINQIIEADDRVDDVDDLEGGMQVQHRLEDLRTELNEFSTKSEGMGPEIEYDIAGAFHLIERIDRKITEATLQMIDEESSSSDDPVTTLRALVDVLGPDGGEGADRTGQTTASADRLENMYRTTIDAVLEDMGVMMDPPSTDSQTTLELVDTAMQHHRKLAGAESHTRLETMYVVRVTALGADQAMWLADQGQWNRFERELARVREAYESIRGDLDPQFDADDELLRRLDEAVFGAIERDYDRLYSARAGADVEPIRLDEHVADALPFNVEATEGLPSHGSYRFPAKVEGTLEAVDVVVPIFDRLDRTIMMTFGDVMDRWKRVSDHPSVRPLRSWGTVPYPWFVTRHALNENQAPTISHLDAQVRVMDQVINAVARAHRVDIPHGGIGLQAISFDTDSISSAQLGGWGNDRIIEEPRWIHMQPEEAKAEDIRDLCNLWGQLRAKSDSSGDAEAQTNAADEAIETLAASSDSRTVDDGLDELRSLLPRP
jgi:hypothetical protein